MIPELPAPVLSAVVACGLAICLIAYAAAAPTAAKLPLHRRRVGIAAPKATGLANASVAATALIDRAIRKHDRGGKVETALEDAGLKVAAKDFILMVVAIALAVSAVLFVASGPGLGLLAALLVPVLAKFWLGSKKSKRRRQFADQLDDSLQVLSSSLRAGHSLLQSLATVARESEEPTSEEFARIINETRVGRDLTEALGGTGARMQCDDFVWVAQAIQINREVGGNLAEVLDGVGNTIRERNQIRGQVKALSAEGKMSAVVLMALPFCITGFLAVFNPNYLSGFTSSLVGYVLLVVSAVLLVVGALWLRKVVQIKF